jgi:hypothetical protein
MYETFDLPRNIDIVSLCPSDERGRSAKQKPPPQRQGLPPTLIKLLGKAGDCAEWSRYPDVLGNLAVLDLSRCGMSSHTVLHLPPPRSAGQSEQARIC